MSSWWRAAGADGAHVNGLAALEEALPSLKPDRIAGVGGLATRHDSMTAGEKGADYVLFGEPDADGKRPSMDAVAERLDWWAELFEPPCIGYAASRDEAHAFVLAGADFILLSRCRVGRSARRLRRARRDRPGDAAGACGGARSGQENHKARQA